MKNLKNILLSLLVFLVIGCFVFLFLKLNRLENMIVGGESDSLVDITPGNKTSNLSAIQSELKNNINSNHDSIAAIYAVKTMGSIVEDESGEEKYITTVESLEGNAIVISNDGYLITNKHVVSSAEKATYKVELQGEFYPVDKVRFDKLLDIAILRIKVKNATIPANIVAMSQQLEIGDVVFAIKNDPEIDEFLVKGGIVNSKNQKFEIQNNNDVYAGLIKNSTSIEGGFSGGPLVNINGEVVGINTAIDNIEYSASYALPVNKEFINQTLYSIKESGQIIRPYLGIEYEDSDFYPKVTNIIEGSPADETDLHVDDIIVGINNLPVTYNDFLYNLYTYKVGKQITLNIMRDGHKKDVQITVGKE